MARQQNNQNALVVQEPRMPAPEDAYLNRLGFNQGQWKALVEAIWPSARTVDGVVMALEYCKARGLDPFKKPVHVVPMYNAALGREVETVWPGIAELRTTASRTGVWAGNDETLFGPTLKRSFEDSRQVNNRDGGKSKQTESCPMFEFPEWAQITVYKIIGGQRVPFVGPKVRFVETFSGKKGLRVPNERWQLAPFQMLEKCAEAAALRRAFPEEMAGIMTAEEMEGQVTHDAGHGAPITEHRPVLDGGEARPTREDDQPAEGSGNWPKHVVEDLELQKQNIDSCDDPNQLRDEKPRVLGNPARREWPDAARQELESYCDARIRKLEAAAGAVDDDETADDDPPAEETGSEELPLEGKGAATDQTGNERAADEEEQDESGSY